MNVGAITAALPPADSPRFAETMNRLPPAQQRQVVARQFEAILLRQLLAPVLDSLPGDPGGVYGFFLTDAFAQKLSGGSGFGLARVIEQQLSPPTAAPAPPPSPTRNGPPKA